MVRSGLSRQGRPEASQHRRSPHVVMPMTQQVTQACEPSQPAIGGRTAHLRRSTSASASDSPYDHAPAGTRWVRVPRPATHLRRRSAGARQQDVLGLPDHG